MNGKNASPKKPNRQAAHKKKPLSRLAAAFLLGGILLFLVEVVADVTMITFEKGQFFVAQEFEKSLRPYAIAASLYTGASLLISQIQIYKSWPTSSRPAKAKKYKRERLTLIPITILAVSMIGGMTYLLTIDLPARILHEFAPHQPITVQATAVSVYDPRREYRRNCNLHLGFQSSLEISQLTSYICITRAQEQAYFQTLPQTITLCGEQSPYGYRLDLCKVGK